jgi:hypothetical protein
MKKVIFCTLLTFAYSANNAFATHEGTLYPSSVVYTISKKNIVISASCDDNTTLKSLILKFGDKIYEVPFAEIEGSGKDFNLSSMRVLTGVASGSSNAEQSTMQRFTVSISCGPVSVNTIGDTEIKSFDEVRFEFADGKLYCRRRAVSEGDGKMSWKLFRKNPNENEVADGRDINSSANPFRDDS